MNEPLPLSFGTLPNLSSIATPTYDLTTRRAGIVHLGLGAFHRAHFARYTHDLMERQDAARQWAIVGAGLLPSDNRICGALEAQQGLYTLVERLGGEEHATLIGSLCDVIYAAESSDRLLAALDGPNVRIVSLTVTENGYCLNSSTKLLDPDHPAIVHDLTHPGWPQSPIGIIVEAYRRRRAGGGAAFAALSCDNIQHNGRVLQGAVMTMARMRDPGLAEWIEEHASFPSSMVDRITPITTSADIEELAAKYGVADRAPVFAEIFRQWVIEDRFSLGRPKWDLVGAQFVADVSPYELMKLRLLNASHLALAGLGQLAGYTYVDEVMCDALFPRYMRALMDLETGPTLLPVPGIALDEYKASLVERFANYRIKDTLTRINTDAPINLLLDPIRDRLAKGQRCELLTLALAAWMRRAQGSDDQGRPLKIEHPLAQLISDRAREGRTDPRPLLNVRALFGDLVAHDGLVTGLEYWLGQLYGLGARATLAEALNGCAAAAATADS